VADRCVFRDFRRADRTRSLAFAFVAARRACKDVSVKDQSRNWDEER
jgi:hypothetical protein